MSQPWSQAASNPSTPVVAQAQAQDVATPPDDTVVSVHGVGKMYRLYDRPQDLLKQQLFGRFGKRYGREFWALRDVSCDVRRGEAVGIIGRNGSGKSTLLQLLAGVLKPTTGEVWVQGQVAALLELGSGFNPEFTGRENVFLNGAILGLTRVEMEERFAEIAAFADIGAFVDQPVKTYSSGMFVRLAFAVSTALDPDILLIDEALAVGDVFFRQKCYRRLAALRARGVAIVLVSHAMNDVEQFCTKALLLHHGDVIFQGTASETVKRYYLIEQEDRLAALAAQLGQSQTNGATPEPLTTDNHFWPPAEAFLDIAAVAQVSNGWARCTSVALCNSQGQPCRVFQQGETASFFYEFELLQDIEVPIGGLVIQNDKGVIVHGKSTLEYDSGVPFRVTQGSQLRFRQDITLEIQVGEYTFTVGLATINHKDYEHKELYPHADLHRRIVRVCHLPSLNQFAVVFRANGKPVQLLHYGVANLQGNCQVSTLSAVSSEPPVVDAFSKISN